MSHYSSFLSTYSVRASDYGMRIQEEGWVAECDPALLLGRTVDGR